MAREDDLKANRIDATIVDKENKKVSVIEMSCPWVENREEKDADKTTKYGPLRWELEQRYPEYRVTEFNIIVDVLGGYSRDVRKALKELEKRHNSSADKEVSHHKLT